MATGLREHTAPSAEPVSLADLRAHVRVDSEDEDSLLRGLIVAARQYCEQYSGRCLAAATYEATFDAFPGGSDSIYLPLNPTIADATNQVSYVDTAGATQVAAVTWRHEVDPAEVYPLFEANWPQTRHQPGAVAVRWRCAPVPQTLSLARQAILLIAGDWFANREDVVTGTIVARVPNGAIQILEMLLLEDF